MRYCCMLAGCRRGRFRAVVNSGVCRSRKRHFRSRGITGSLKTQSMAMLQQVGTRSSRRRRCSANLMLTGIRGWERAGRCSGIARRLSGRRCGSGFSRRPRRRTRLRRRIWWWLAMRAVLCCRRADRVRDPSLLFLLLRRLLTE